MRAVYFERIAWVLLAALIAFWTWFGLASALSEKLGWQNFVQHLLLPGGVFAAIAAIAWRSRVIGGVLLIAAGALIALLYPFAGGRFPGSTVVLLLSTLAAPPIAAGVLMLESTRSTQH